MDQIILTAYGVLLLAGSYFGYKAGSKISLIMGIVSGTAVLISVYISQSNPVVGFRCLVVISGILTGMFAKRLFKTKKFMPSGMLLIFSLIALIVSLKYLS